MDMPEIFSAYDVYVNGTLVMSMGELQPDSYQDATGNRMVIFSPDESGMAIILIAVSNQSYIYGGMIYPPAFGTLEALSDVREIRLMLCLCIIFALLIFAVISLYLWLRIRHINAFFFFLLCITMIGWMSYPIVHTMWILPVFPYYFLELLFYYLTMFLMLVMHNEICSVYRNTARISSCIALLFCP